MTQHVSRSSFVHSLYFSHWRILCLYFFKQHKSSITMTSQDDYIGTMNYQLSASSTQTKKRNMFIDDINNELNASKKAKPILVNSIHIDSKITVSKNISILINPIYSRLALYQYFSNIVTSDLCRMLQDFIHWPTHFTVDHHYNSISVKIVTSDLVYFSLINF